MSSHPIVHPARPIEPSPARPVRRHGVIVVAVAATAAIAGTLVSRPAEAPRTVEAPAVDAHAAHGGSSSDHTGHAAHAAHGASPSNHTGHDASGGMPPGYAAVALDRSQADAMGLATVAVAEHELVRTVRTVGTIALDETRTAHVHARVRGWIDAVQASFVGRSVRAGEPLCTIDSQEVYAAELELVQLASAGNPQLLDAARRRLSLWEVPRRTLEEVEAAREPQRTFPVLAPRGGVVIAKQAVEGLYIDPSIELYTISDVSRVWAVVDIYESDVARVRAGAVAMLHVEGLAAPREAKVSFLAPTIDERTRTRKVRFELDNRDRTLLPGAFVTAELVLSYGRGLAIPRSAVIRTGARAIVFVVHGGVHAMPREVVLGPLAGDQYRVERGLAAGEEVAIGAQFLLDSESRLQATGGGGGHVH